MAQPLEQPGDGVASSDGAPGPLTRLLQDLAASPEHDLLAAWQEELSPGDRLDRFEIRREIGRGGFGVVYEAFDGELGRAVAVKTLRPGRTRRELSSGWLKREAEAIARLSHPGIVTVHDVCNCERGPYLVMELLEGRTLAERLRDGPLPEGEALGIARDVALALAHAHGRGVLHRDLKPANVFLCEDGRVKLLDFGLAHLLGAADATGSGTPGYMAPEQAEGVETDARADVYAAGVTLREMLSGRPAPAGEARASARISRLLERALSPDPGDRPRDGAEWLAGLDALRGTTERRRRAWRALGIGFLGALLATGLAYLAWGTPAPGPSAPAIPSVAVLPFVDLSPERDQQYLSDGVAEELIDALARVPGIKVAGRASSFQFRGGDADPAEVGHALGVTNLVEGSVRRAGNRVRISASLVRTTGERVWGDTYDRDTTDVFSVQQEIAQLVASSLRVKLAHGNASRAGNARSPDPEAYRLYLLGKHRVELGTPSDVEAGVLALEQSVRRDEDFVPARAWLAFSAQHLAAIGPPDPSRRRDPAFDAGLQSARASEVAEELGARFPDSADALWLRGFMRAARAWDWRGALADGERALTLAPGDARVRLHHARILAATGRLAEATELARGLVESDPLSAQAYRWLGDFEMGAGRFAEAEDLYRRGLLTVPRHAFLLRQLAVSLVLQERHGEALEVAERNPSEWMREYGRALALHGLGRTDESTTALRRVEAREKESRTLRYHLGVVRAWRGETDVAFAWLEKALQDHDGGLNMVVYDPLLARVRGDPRYASLLRRMNLPVH